MYYIIIIFYLVPKVFKFFLTKHLRYVFILSILQSLDTLTITIVLRAFCKWTTYVLLVHMLEHIDLYIRLHLALQLQRLWSKITYSKSKHLAWKCIFIDITIIVINAVIKTNKLLTLLHSGTSTGQSQTL